MDPTMPDGSPMYPPCTCPECGPCPGIDYQTDENRMARINKVLEMDRAERQRRVQAWRDSCHQGS